MGKREKGEKEKKSGGKLNVDLGGVDFDFDLVGWLGWTRVLKGCGNDR